MFRYLSNTNWITKLIQYKLTYWDEWKGLFKKQFNSIQFKWPLIALGNLKPDNFIDNFAQTIND